MHRPGWGTQFKAALASTTLFSLAACASIDREATTKLASYDDAVTVPYRLNSHGHFIVDVEINGDAHPMVVDSGATISALYESFVRGTEISQHPDREIRINGLIESENRPVLQGVEYFLGGKRLRPRDTVLLATPEHDQSAVGILGADMLGDSVILFDHLNRTMTILPSSSFNGNEDLRGWLEIPLYTSINNGRDYGLHFTNYYDGRNTFPVLVDTGAAVTVVNWELAENNPRIRRLRSRLRQNWELEGAIGEFNPDMIVEFQNLQLGEYYWARTPVSVLNFESLEPIIPENTPLMISGVNLFNKTSFAFDFGGDKLYLLPPPGMRRAPKSDGFVTLITFNYQSENVYP